MVVKTITGATLIVTLLSVPAFAQSSSRVERIKATNTIVIGAPTAALPFAFLDESQNPVGYTVEICKEVAALVAKELKVEKLTVRHVPTTSSTRLPLIQNGTIDLECGNTTNKEDRKKQVAFSPTTFVSQVVLAARKNSNVDVNNLASFKGKTIAATSGGQTYKTVADLNTQHAYGITMADAPDASRSFLLMETGRADAVASDDGLLYAAVASSKNPGDFVVGSKGLDFAPYGIVLPKDDTAFKTLVDDAVKALMANGRIGELYEKYFNSPIPPRNINLQYPMSSALKKAIAAPTDASDPAAYAP